MHVLSTEALTAEQVGEIVSFLDVRQLQPDVNTLERLIDGYVQRVPWESATRIVRRAETPDLKDRPRWPSEFWQLAVMQGTGGTCFESNYAFWKLLDALGFQAYLTINDMGDTHACHSAIVVEFPPTTGDAEDGDERYLVDVGLPLYTPIPLDRTQPTSAVCEYQQYTLQPLVSPDSTGTAAHRYQVERAPHPRPIAYTLVDTPVPEDAYIQAVIADYDAGGLFLDHVVISKLVDGMMTRFSTYEKPYVLEVFVNGERTTKPLPSDASAAADEISACFGMPAQMLEKALQLIDTSQM